MFLISFSTIKNIVGIGVIIYGFLIYLTLFIFICSKYKMDKFLTIIFALSIPFFNDLNIFSGQIDFHVVSKPYFTFNILHIIVIFLLMQIFINRKKIKLNIDLIILIAFNTVCIFSIFHAFNSEAAFFDYIRYFNFSIIYIYFSRIFEFDKYGEVLIKCLVIGLVIQLVLGILQKINGGPLGLSFLGETSDVFRLYVSGYEKGMSGTFGHPGPYALYSVLILPCLLFNYKLNKKIRILGIFASTMMIILAAGRTTIASMFIVYFFFFFEKILNLNTKNIIVILSTILCVIVLGTIFSEQIHPIIDRFITSDTDKQLSNRLEHFEIAKYYIDQSPLTGVGLNNYLDLTNRDFPISFDTNFFLNNPIHNVYLLYAVEIGLIGLVLFLIFLLNNFVYLIKCRKSKDKDTFNRMKGYMLSLIIYCIYNFQGWGGVQSRSLIMAMLMSALMYNTYQKLRIKS